MISDLQDVVATMEDEAKCASIGRRLLLGKAVTEVLKADNPGDQMIHRCLDHLERGLDLITPYLHPLVIDDPAVTAVSMLEARRQAKRRYKSG